jgi:hypothetical protein
MSESLASLENHWRGLIGTRCAEEAYRVDDAVLVEYANLFGYRSARFHSREAAVGEGFRDLVAPAGFATVFTMQAVLGALHNPLLRVPFDRNLHAGQTLDFGEPVCANDRLSTTVTLHDMAAKGRNLFYYFATRTLNQDRLLCVSGLSTQVVRFDGE